VDDDARTRRRELEGDRPPEALPGARDERDRVGKIQTCLPE
jgi:hypothetical protein